MMNRNVPTLALPPIPPSYLRIYLNPKMLASNNYSLQSSVSNSPYRMANPAHSSTTESKSVDKVNIYTISLVQSLLKCLRYKLLLLCNIVLDYYFIIKWFNSL